MKALEEITELPNVHAIYHTTGDVYAIIIAKFTGVDELQKFLGGWTTSWRYKEARRG